MGKVYRGSIGLKIILDTGVQLTDATTAKILVKKPDSETEWIANFEDRESGKISYTIKDGDLDETGLYLLQAYVEFGDGSKLYGETARLVVFEKFS